MKKKPLRGLALGLPSVYLVALLLIAGLITVGSDKAAAAMTPGRYIVVLKASVSASAVANDHAVVPEFVYSHALNGFSAVVPPGRLNGLQRDPRVEYVELDQPVHLFAQTVPTGIKRIFGDANPEIDIDASDDWRVDVDVAVIDTGIDLDHPDLNVVASTNCSGGGPFTQSCGSGGNDGNGHGTHVAGTIGALDNNIGVVGVAPGARLWAVKVLSDSGSGYYSWVIAGIDYVTANAASIEVANMSLGGGNSDALCTAVNNSVAAGVVYAVAAGNSDANASTSSPANCADVITTSALADFNGAPGGGAASTCRSDQDDTLADFSNWGATIEVTAPGVCILSTWKDGGYNTISGTSMASPHVAGAAALLASMSKPSNKSQALAIRTAIISRGNFNWTDDSGDGIKEPLLDVSNTAVFNPALVPGGGGDTVAPTVTGVSPSDGATGVAVGTNVSVTFSEAVDPTTVNGSTFTVSDGGGVAGSISVAGNGLSATFDPSADLANSTLYTITVTSGVQDLSGNSLDQDPASGGTQPFSSSFTTVAAPPQGGDASMHVSDLDGAAVSGGSRWTANVTITIRDGNGFVVPNATVSGTWSGGASGSASCVTNAFGQCTVSKSASTKRSSSVTFTVTNVSLTGWTYDSSANSDPDGDSDGTNIVVNRP
jgi:subtilisin